VFPLQRGKGIAWSLVMTTTTFFWLRKHPAEMRVEAPHLQRVIEHVVAHGVVVWPVAGHAREVGEIRRVVRAADAARYTRRLPAPHHAGDRGAAIRPSAGVISAKKCCGTEGNG
jgi:hypothetical protein